jgi:hypothetical protein
MATKPVVEGIPELQADVAKWLALVPAALEDANTAIGPRAIGKAQPTPLEVGTGEGATPHPVVDGKTLRIEAGGTWRAAEVPEAPWGISEGPPRTSERPYLIGALRADLSNIEGDYLGAVMGAARKIGWPMTQVISSG